MKDSSTNEISNLEHACINGRFPSLSGCSNRWCSEPLEWTRRRWTDVFHRELTEYWVIFPIDLFPVQQWLWKQFHHSLVQVLFPLITMVTIPIVLQSNPIYIVSDIHTEYLISNLSFCNPMLNLWKTFGRKANIFILFDIRVNTFPNRSNSFLSLMKINQWTWMC